MGTNFLSLALCFYQKRNLKIRDYNFSQHGPKCNSHIIFTPKFNFLLGSINLKVKIWRKPQNNYDCVDTIMFLWICLSYGNVDITSAGWELCFWGETTGFLRIMEV